MLREINVRRFIKRQVVGAQSRPPVGCKGYNVIRPLWKEEKGEKIITKQRKYLPLVFAIAVVIDQLTGRHNFGHSSNTGTASFESQDAGMSANFVVAGGSKGIGLELVRLLDPSADRINVYSRSVDELTVNETIRHHACDFSQDEVQLDELPESIQGVVYCPGSINLRSFRALKPDDFRRDFEINLIGAVKFLQACLPGLKKGAGDHPTGVVLFSTVAVGQGMPMHASVAAAKGAVEGLTRSLAAEWAPRVRVNCLAPALTDTPLASRFFSSDDSRAAMAKKYPLGRTGLPNDLAAIARFLLLPESSWITGQVIGVDGGLSSLRA